MHTVQQTKSHVSFAPNDKFYLTSLTPTKTEAMSSYIVKIKHELSLAVLIYNGKKRLHSHKAKL